MPKTSDEYYIEADELYEAQRCDESLALYEEGLRVFPEDLDLMLGKSLCLFSLGDYPLVKRLLEKVIKADPDNGAAFIGLINTCSLMGRKEEVLRYATRIAETVEIDADFAYQIGDMLADNEHYQEAAHFFTRSLALGNKDHHARLGLAMALYNMELWPAAKAMLERLRQDNPEDPEVLNWLGIACYKAKDKDGAMEAWKKIPCDKHYDFEVIKRLLRLTRPGPDDDWGQRLRERLKEVRETPPDEVEDLLKMIAEKRKQGRKAV